MSLESGTLADSFMPMMQNMSMMKPSLSGDILHPSLKENLEKVISYVPVSLCFVIFPLNDHFELVCFQRVTVTGSVSVIVIVRDVFSLQKLSSFQHACIACG